jgi:hypothetical protein
MHSVKRLTSLCIFGMFLVMSIPSFVQAGGLQVYPLYLFLNAPTRSVTISITNPLERSQEAWIEFRYGFPLPGDSNKFVMHYVDPPYTGEPSAVQWLKAYPERFVIGPKESQVVRILVRPPVGLQSGEYWARVVVSSADQNSPRPTTTPGGTYNTRLKYISQIDVPLHFRSGNATTGLAIRRVTPTISNGVLKLDIEVSRSGNAAYWGKMTATIKNHDGKIMKNENHPVAIYKDMVYPLWVDISTVPSGSYSLELLIANRRPGIQQSFLLKADPVRYNAEITIP